MRIIETPIGPCTLEADETGLRGARWGEGDRAVRRDVTPRGRAHLDAAERALVEFFEGRRRDFRELVLAPCGTAFQQRVWRALLEIPFGETRSYRDVAQAIGNPRATRAVGLANGRNPIWVIIPCHRVIASDGGLGGYGGGLERKAWLLAHEGCAPQVRRSRGRSTPQGGMLWPDLPRAEAAPAGRRPVVGRVTPTRASGN